jgi:biopolymer transport protein ExbB
VNGAEGVGARAAAHFLDGGDPVLFIVAGLLLAMSICAWVLIFWRGWVLRQARRSIRRAVPAFWSAASAPEGKRLLQGFDRSDVVAPLLVAAMSEPAPGSLQAGGSDTSRLTRRLRDALHGVLGQLQFGQVVLASIGATAPFIGLLGTVWGIYHALLGMSSERAITIDKLAGPVGEALVMTAAGLAVAIPAVLAYNVFGKMVGACEAELEGFAHDLRELFAGGSATAASVDREPAGAFGSAGR